MAIKRGISLLLVVGAFFAIGGGQELAADDNADAIIRDGIIHSANGGNFGDFRRQYQSRLLFALDNALSQKAQETLNEFAAVKKAQVQVQTPLGNRQGQIAANIIGAFAESQNSAFGWQVRAFGAEDGGKGANVGVFYRNIVDYTKIGINSFVDYEDGDYDGFYRASIGGEISASKYSFAANYYLPITDDKRGGGKVAFSQKGYDANVRINIPQLDFLKVAADYYHYDGDYGVEDDNGLRYGFAVQPINDLRIGIFYDDGGEEFGGDISFVHNFDAPQKRQSKVVFAPDLFAPVVREYSQRIVLATLANSNQVITITQNITTSAESLTITSNGMTQTVIANMPTTITQVITLMTRITTTFGGMQITITTTVGVDAPPPQPTMLAAMFSPNLDPRKILATSRLNAIGQQGRRITSNYTGTAGTLSAIGGSGNYTYSSAINVAGLSIESNGVMLFSTAMRTTTTITIIVNDDDDNAVSIQISLSVLYNTPAQEALAFFTTRIDNVPDGTNTPAFIEGTVDFRILLALPPDDGTRPIVITANMDLGALTFAATRARDTPGNPGIQAGIIVIRSNAGLGLYMPGTQFSPVTGPAGFGVIPYTLTIVSGSEIFL